MAEPVAAVPTSANGIIPVMAEGVPQPVESQEVAGVVQEVAGTVREVAVAVAPIVENANPDEVPAAAVEAAAAAAAAGAAGAASAASAAGASGAVSAAAASSPNTGGSSDSSPEKTTPPVAAPAVTPAKPDYKAASSVYEFTVKDASGNDFSMEKYKGHVLLIVNIASKCGYTASNNKELTELKEKYESRGWYIEFEIYFRPNEVNLCENRDNLKRQILKLNMTSIICVFFSFCFY